MATVRVEKISDYTTLSNRALDDKRLSMKAVGLLVYMLRLPDDWDFTLEWLAKKHKDGLSSIRSAMKELEDAGYVTRGTQQRSQEGTFQGSDYIIREDPDADQTGRPVTACENRTRTACENPISVFPTSENRTQSNTNIPSTDKPIPPIAPQGAGADYVPKKAPAWKPERFARFWNFYPLHKSKQAAIRAWDRLKPSDELLAVIGRALERQIAEKTERGEEWKLHASTYLNNARWTDEPELVTHVIKADLGDQGGYIWV